MNLSDYNKINFRLKIYFIITIIITVLLFMLTVAYTQKYDINNTNIILERYAIIITLIGIPFSLKLFHSKMKQISKVETSEYLRKYVTHYYIRLLILTIICFFNIIALYITGSKNFYFMVIITIFAFFLCAPQKRNIDIHKDDEVNEIEE